jgi:hypothetical protein
LCRRQLCGMARYGASIMIGIVQPRPGAMRPGQWLLCAVLC